MLEIEGDVECDVRLRHGSLLTGLDENTPVSGPSPRHASSHLPAMPQLPAPTFGCLPALSRDLPQS